MTVLDDRTVADSAGAATTTPTRRPRRENLESERANRSRAAQRALDRRRNRVVAQGSTRTRGERDSGVRRVSLFTRARSVPFVVPVLALLVVGLGLSLWLSTKAAQDSYRLGIAQGQPVARRPPRQSQAQLRVGRLRARIVRQGSEIGDDPGSESGPDGCRRQWQAQGARRSRARIRQADGDDQPRRQARSHQQDRQEQGQ